MTICFAPVLDAVAARIAGPGPSWRSEPSRWAYCLREAVSLLRPDWVVTHHDLTAEVDALTGIDDLLDADLAGLGPARSAVELTGTLAALYRDRPVAASLSGPVTVTRQLMDERPEAADDRADWLVDVGDLLADLAAAYVEAGATRIVVWEPEAVPDFEPDDVRAAHAPVLRRLDTLGVSPVLCGAPGLDAAGYHRHLTPAAGLLAAQRLIDEPFAVVWADACAGADGLVVSDGPLPGDGAMENLAAAARRWGR